MWLTANRVGTFQEYDVLRKASQRLDLLAMAWQQTVMKRSCVLQYLYLDSSPQGGFNYFVGKAREFVFPKVFEQLRFGGAPMRLWTQRMNLSLQEHFVGTRTIPVTVLQHGQAGLVYKLHNVLHAIGLECGSAANFESWRWGCDVHRLGPVHRVQACRLPEGRVMGFSRCPSCSAGCARGR
jgi:hypothetical protein